VTTEPALRPHIITRSRRRRPRLVCIGDLMLDVVARVDGGIEPGTDVPGTIRFRGGGSACNTARVFAALGARSTVIGAIGASDDLGRKLVAALRLAGVTVHAVRVVGASPRLVALISPSGERSFVTDRGVADLLPVASIRTSWVERADAIHVPAYSLLRPPLSDAALHAVRLVRESGGLVSVDLASRAPLLAAGADNGLRAVRAAAPDLLFANQDEVGALVGRSGARRLLDVAPIVVVKQGAQGCHVLWRAGDGPRPVLEIDVATRPLTAVDTTGAGNAFDAGFLHSLLAGGHGPASGVPSAAVVRRAALAGHRAAARLLTSRRPELAL